ncbi:MAG: hypothetical protein IKO29_05415 [Bacteroidales bacterium]|nr:hypothetical protein [Bacteroidales bacterium]
MKRILPCLLCFMSLSAYAQHTVLVNPDGTHSVAIQTGNIITEVNPDGTHSTGILAGSSTTIVNPDGTHTTVIETGNDNTTAMNKDTLDRVVVSAICAEPANIIRDIPQQVEYITVYTQYRKPRSAVEKAVYGESPYLCPYVIRFQDSTALTIPEKQMKKVIKRLKRIPVEQIEFVGFELEHIGNMLDDEGAQRASATVAGYGLHDYAKRDTPVYYYRRK